jgi:hypothetical protein
MEALLSRAERLLVQNTCLNQKHPLRATLGAKLDQGVQARSEIGMAESVSTHGRLLTVTFPNSRLMPSEACGSSWMEDLR